MKVLTDTESLSAVADAIRAKSGGDEELVFPDGFVDAIEGIEGGNSYYDTFWDNFQKNGSKIDYSYAFYKDGWNDTTFKPKYDILPANAASMFSQCEMTDVQALIAVSGVTVDFSRCSSVASMLARSKITKFPTVDVSSATQVSYMCNYATELEEITITGIRQTHDFSGAFSVCSKLKNLMVSGVIGKNFSVVQSPLLTSESVQSIIDALADLTDASTQTLSLHADVKAALSEEQLVSITQKKNWTVA